MLNSVNLVGRLGADPELRYTPTGKAVAKLNVAVSRDRKVNDTYPTDWFTVIAWGKTAEFAANYLTKGRLISVSGRLTTRTWVSNDGQKHFYTEIITQSLNILDRAKEGASGAGSRPSGASAEAEDDADYDPFAEE